MYFQDQLKVVTREKGREWQKRIAKSMAIRVSQLQMMEMMCQRYEELAEDFRDTDLTPRQKESLAAAMGAVRIARKRFVPKTG